MRTMGRFAALKHVGAACFGLFLFTILACGPITKDDLHKWSQNDEGLKRISEVMQDEDVPFHIKVEAVTILAEHDFSTRLRGIVSKYKDPQELADAASVKFIEALESGDEDRQQQARDGLFQLLGTMGDEARDISQKALTKWIFAGVTSANTREEIWEAVSPKIALNQVRDLGEYAVPHALIMIEKRVESESWNVLAWIDFVFGFYNPEDEDPERKKRAEQHKAGALEALKRNHAAVFKLMETDKDVFFDPNDVLIVEKFDTPLTVDYLLDMARHEKIDPATQYEALIIAEKMFDHVVGAKDLNKYTDKMLSVVINKLPEIRDRTGMNRLKQAQILLEKSQIQGLKDVPLVVEDDKGGEKQTKWKGYLSARNYHPAKLVFGVAKDFLEPLVDKQRDQLLKEWDTKWTQEQAVAKAVADKAAAEKAAADKAAADKAAADKAAGVKPAPAKDDNAAKPEEEKAVAEAPAEKPDFTVDPAFAAELEARIDKNVTPLVEDWLSAQLVIKRLFGIAGLKYLGTPNSSKLLQALAKDATDVSAYFGKGILLSVPVNNALKGIVLAKEFEQLKLDAIRDKILSPDEVERVRQRMLADLGLPATELETKYREELRKRKERYIRQKEKLAQILKKYQKAIKWICFAKVRDYPASDKKLELETYINNTAITCRKEAEEKLTKKKLDFFGFKEDVYRSAVILAIMKKEITRKYYIKAKARAYLRAAVEQGVQESNVVKALRKTKKWSLEEATIRTVIDKFVKIALDMAAEDHASSNGQRGISAADIAEYREFLELPETYALGTILVLRGKLEWTDVDAETQKATARSLVREAAKAAFDVKTFFEKDEKLVEFLIAHNDDLWYLMQDIGTQGGETAKSRWAISNEDFVVYAGLTTKARQVVDGVLAKALADKTISETQAKVLAKSYPFFETATEAMLAEFEIIRKRIADEAKKKAEEEAKKKAADEAKAGKAEDAKAPEKKADAKADAKAPEKKADAKTDAKAPEKKADAKTDAKAPEKKGDAKTDAKAPEKKGDAKSVAKPAK